MEEPSNKAEGMAHNSGRWERQLTLFSLRWLWGDYIGKSGDSSGMSLWWSYMVLSGCMLIVDALEPHMTKETLEFHWGKHHRAYVDNLNKQIAGTDLEGMELDELYKFGYNNGNPTAYFNNAGQVWNHDFFWQSIRPRGGKKPRGEVLYLIERDFGSFEAFVEEFKQAATTQFGSGWAWLVAKHTDPLAENKFGKLAVEKTFNAVNPVIFERIPLLTIDVWEHAYYLDFQDRRPDYISTFINELINWDMVTLRLERAKAFINFYDVIVPDDQIEYV